MTDSLLTSYEAVPYNSRPVGPSEIGALEAVALLYGIRAPAADRARVLELGCASGGNLIPMAYRYPDATFVGVDLTPGQVALGQAEVEALGLGNITLRAMSIADIGDDFGTFDYIICHGVYSWVPPEVQEAILRVSSRNLSPSGLAYISYNTLPGWHVRGMVREMVMYHDDRSLPPQDRVVRAKAFVQLLAAQGGGKTTPHRLCLAEEAMNIEAQDDAHFLHEQLEQFNEPLYFSEFARRSASAGLRVVGEAKLTDTGPMTPDWARQAAGDDSVRAQQYMDFVSGRTFRRSLLCHAGVPSSPRPGAEALHSLYVAARAEAATPDDADRAKGGRVESFALPTGGKMTTNNPLVLAAFHVLLRVAPVSLSFNELLQRVNDRLDLTEQPDSPTDSDHGPALSELLLQLALSGFVEVHRYASPFTRTMSAQPRASAIAALKAASSNAVPSLRHAVAELSDVEREVLGDLDGSRGRAELTERLFERLERGALTVEGELPSKGELANLVEAVLDRLSSVALLEA